MVAVVLHQFIDTFTFKKLPPISATCYKGREDTFARLLDAEAFSLLACEPQFNMQLHDFTIAVITHYAAPPNRHEYETSQNIQASRGEFLSVIGKFFKTTAAEMKKIKYEKITKHMAVDPNETQTFLKVELETNFPRLEIKFRNTLRSYDVYGNAELPAALYPITDAKVKVVEPKKGDRTVVPPKLSNKKMQALADISLDADAGASKVKLEQGDSEAEQGKSLSWDLAVIGETIMVFVKGEPDVLEVGAVQIMTGSSNLCINGVDCAGEWEIGELICLKAPFAGVQLASSPHRQVTVHFDAMRPMTKIKKGKEAEEPQVYHPSHIDDGERLDDYNFDNFNPEFMKHSLITMLNRAHVTTADGLELLQRVVLKGPCEGDPKKGAKVLQVKSIEDIDVGGIMLSPVGGAITAFLKDAKKEAINNPSSISSVTSRVFFAAAEDFPAGKVPTTTWTITSPLKDYNSRKRKADELDDDKASFATIAHYWGVLYAPAGAQSNMIAKPIVFEDLGVKALDKAFEIKKFKRGYGLNLDIPFLTNTKVIKAGEVLMMPSRCSA